MFRIYCYLFMMLLINCRTIYEITKTIRGTIRGTHYLIANVKGSGLLFTPPFDSFCLPEFTKKCPDCKSPICDLDMSLPTIHCPLHIIRCPLLLSVILPPAGRRAAGGRTFPAVRWSSSPSARRRWSRPRRIRRAD